MKTLIFFCSIVLLSSAAFAQVEPNVPLPETVEKPEPLNENYNVVDESAEYPGGREGMMRFFMNNLQYPQTAIEADLQGRCYVKFLIDKEGSISNIKIAKGVPGCPECDREATRLVSMMPKWKPGKVNGQPVASYFNLPVTFKLNTVDK